MQPPSKDQGADATRVWRDALERISDPFDGPDLDGCRALAQRALDEGPPAPPACLEPQEAMAVLLTANSAAYTESEVRRFPLSGAPSHSGADLLSALRDLGFGLAPLSPKETR